MRCRRVRKLLSDYFDGCLPERRANEVREHCARCRECGSSLRRLERTLALVSVKALERPPEEYWAGFWPRLAERLAEEERASTPARALAELIFVRRPLAAVGAFAALVLAALLVFNALMFRAGERGEAPGPGAARPARRDADFILGPGGGAPEVHRFVLRGANPRRESGSRPEVHYVLARATSPPPSSGLPVLY